MRLDIQPPTAREIAQGLLLVGLSLTLGCPSTEIAPANLDGGVAVDAGAQDAGETVDAPEIETVALEAGCFTMGCSAGDGECKDDEAPAHEVCVSGFEISRTEVTAAQFQACIADGACDAANYGVWGESIQLRNCNLDNPDRQDHPANCLNWHAATEFAAWLARRTQEPWRLPTEAEWEFAARGRDGAGRFPWGDEDATCAYAVMMERAAGCGTVPTSAVCSRPAGNTAQGVCDMSGNIKEWVADYYAEDWYGRSPREDPTGPDSGDQRILRGGSWDNAAVFLRVSNRLGADPTIRSNAGGFRLAK